MKKINIKKLSVLAAVFVLLLTGCSTSKTTDTGSLEAIKKAGVIKIGTNSGYPPYEFYITNDGKKELAGYDVDLAKEIAKKLDVKIEWVDIDFDALVPSLLTNKFDIIMAGLIATDERKKSIDFSDNYYNSKTVAVAKKDVVNDYAKAENLKGKTIVAQTSTTQATAAQSIAGAKVTELPGVTDTISSVLSNQSDVLFIAEVVAKSIVAQNPDLEYVKIEGIDDKLLQDGASVGMKKDDAALQTEINKIITELKDSGKLDEMFVKNQKLAGEQK
ncbi:ABC transporter substrate-binding protein [Mycoplasma sp. P36-A1]|uniref:ABC transporter substrate-binding protein n=1 Tax=Mycoplasma sp. P36-A1 TaxID=3252900 RepID=UPI003C2C4E8E